MRHWTKYAKIEQLRFVFAGGLNTALSYVIYLLALLFVNPQIAYTVSFVIGVLTSYVLHLKLTFRAAHNWRKIVAYPLVYGVQYFIGLLILNAVIAAGIGAEWAPIFILAVSVPIAFLLSRFILRRL